MANRFYQEIKFRKVGMKTRLKGIKELIFNEKLEAINSVLCCPECLLLKFLINQTMLEGVTANQKLELPKKPRLHTANIKACVL